MISLYSSFTLLTLVADILILFLITAFIFRRKLVSSFLNRYLLTMAFIVSFIATLGSLYFSEILGWQPCKLCWFQRIFMYPLPIIFGIALWKKDKGVWRYAIPLAVIGSVFSVYHYYIQRFPAETTCSATGISCQAMSFAYGYISIPIMALTAFISFILLGWLASKK